MKKVVSTELVKLDIKDILSNFRKPDYWKKKWIIFKNKDFDVVWSIKTINVEDNTITSTVKVINYKGPRKISWWGLSERYCRSIPINNPDYTQETFTRSLCASVVEAISDLERSICRETYEYDKAMELENEEREKLEQIANDFLDNEGVTNKDIRDAYVEWYTDNASIYSYTSELLYSSLRKYYPTARLLAYSWFDDKKGFDEEKSYIKEHSGLKSKKIYEIWKAMRELQSEDYLLEAQGKLESI